MVNYKNNFVKISPATNIQFMNENRFGEHILVGVYLSSNNLSNLQFGTEKLNMLSKIEYLKHIVSSSNCVLITILLLYFAVPQT